MIDFKRKLKNFGPLETLVIISFLDVFTMLIWTASTRSEVVKTVSDIKQAEGKAGQSTDKGIIFVSSNNFEPEAGAEWVIGACVKSPCVAAGNNELVSAYR